MEPGTAPSIFLTFIVFVALKAKGHKTLPWRAARSFSWLHTAHLATSWRRTWRSRQGDDPDHALPFLRKGPKAVNLMCYTLVDPLLLGDKVPGSLKVNGCTMVVMWRGLFEVVPR